MKRMLIKFDQTTLANMTAALEKVCRKLPAARDGHETRKRIADAMIKCARAGKRSLRDLEEAGLNMLDEITQSSRFNWFGLRWLRRGK